MLGLLRCKYRFDLHAPKHFLEADNDVVAVVISPGFGNSEAHACGFAHESEFSELADTFVTKFGGVLKFRFDGFFCKSQGLAPKNVMREADS